MTPIEILKVMTQHLGENVQQVERPITKMPVEFKDSLYHVSAPRQCFNNSLMILSEKGLNPNFPDIKYSVGHLAIPSIGIPIEHALLRVKDEYWDPTLDDPEAVFYPIYELSYQQMLILIAEERVSSAPMIYDIHRLIRENKLEEASVLVK
ncbi:hypothetical protein [Ewingella americana]|uniref:Uncharacterized protein n=1 Tax=Ewingella americana TaxID=41202 RepID=A0A502GDH2_9GAMM|nr:hypothetical protein [Ewingella americana]TPG60149.1 hypothetical protein EAH77_16400 [Ewingella americana]